jgi:hypothetical protein
MRRQDTIEQLINLNRMLSYALNDKLRNAPFTTPGLHLFPRDIWFPLSRAGLYNACFHIYQEKYNIAVIK